MRAPGLALLLTIGIALPAWAVGVPRFDPKALADQSESVLIARVGPAVMIPDAKRAITIKGQSLLAYSYRVSADVDRYIKGNGSGKIQVVFELPTTFIGYRSIHSGIRMLFLRKNGDLWTPTNPYYPDLPAVLSPAAEDHVCAPRDCIIRQLISVLASPDTTDRERNEVLALDYALPKTTAVSSALQAALKNSSGSTSHRIRSELVQRGDLEQLSDAITLILTEAVHGDDRATYLYSIGNHIADPKAAPLVLRLLRSGEPEARTAAAEALWHIGHPDTLSAIIPLLRDPTRDVRYYAVRAMAKITGEREWGPSIPEFEHNEEKYLEHWRNWAGNQADLATPTPK